MIRWARLFTILSLIMVVLCACGAGKTLKVGVEKNFKPFAFVEGSEEQGFDVDLWKATAKEAGIKYRLVPMEHGEMLAALEKGDLDAAIAGITINKERKKNLDFALPYYNAGLVLVTKHNNQSIMNLADLKDRIVATRKGSTAYQFVSKAKGVKEIRAYPDIPQAYEAVLKGEADAAVFDEGNAKYYAEAVGNGKIKVVGKRITNEQYGFAFRKGNQLVGSVNNALRTLSDNGTYEQIYQKWFNKKPVSLPGKS